MSIMELAMAKILILPEAARGPFWVKRVVGHPPATSGLPGTTDIIGTPRLVLFVPEGDIGPRLDQVRFTSGNGHRPSQARVRLMS